MKTEKPIQLITVTITVAGRSYPDLVTTMGLSDLRDVLVRRSLMYLTDVPEHLMRFSDDLDKLT